VNAPAYPKTKKSGVEWLGDIPEHWNVRRLKFAAPLINDKVDAQESDLPYMGLEHVESWTGRRIPDETAASDGVATHFMCGDVLFGKLRPYLAKVYLADCEGVASTELLVLRSEEDVCPEFLRYYAVSKDFINAVDSSTYGAKMPRANWELIGNLPFLIPSPDEQRSIAEFLDRKTGRIDELIGKKKELIGKLNEQRSALITSAVTGKIPEIGGRKSAVRMKNSGVEWLGQIPEHWEARRLKFLAAEPLKYGANEAAELDDKELPRFVRITDVNEDGTLRDETFRSIPKETAEPYLLKDGDILLARSGATVGKSFQYSESWGVAAFAGYLIRFRLDSELLHPRFACHFFRTKAYWDWINSSLIQATIQNVSAEKYANLLFPLPPKEEQSAIAKYLDEKTGKLDGLIRKTETAIQTLEEYRTALITAAVTGKIDVRKAV
jgi:restriction endonuclease S subunit